MQIVATFEYSVFLELAITELEGKGITSIYAIPLDLRKEEPRWMDSMHRADGHSFPDKAFIFAFLLATIGSSKGYVWKWGPVIWGLIGAGLGFAIGLLWNVILFLARRQRSRSQYRRGRKGEVVLVVTCEDRAADVVEDILWDHQALGLARTR